VINVGSVGQPRDGNNNAKYVLYAPENHTVELRYVPYDIEAAAEKILAAGLPAHNARRLW
jgi:diadenosine tetraphosphatase ApaH/serine/threonine PP2A family protein phosphatase